MKSEIIDAALLFALLAILVAVLAALAFVPIPEGNQQLFTALASGVVGAGVGTGIGYRFGSSKSSASKDATIAAALNPGDEP